MVLKSVLLKLSELLLSIIVMILVYTFLLVFFPPVLIYKKFVEILGKFYNPKLSQMLSGYSAIFATRLDNYKSPTLTIVTSHIIEIENIAVVNMEKIHKICETIGNSKDFSNITRLFVKFMGFYFWEDNPNFNIKDMITLHSEPLDVKELEKIREDFQTVPFKKGFPIWEMHIYENYSDGFEDIGKRHVAVVNRTHHCLHDWVSILNVTNEVAKILGTMPIKIETNARKTNANNGNNILKIFETSKHIFNLLVYGPYQTLQAFFVANKTKLGNFIGKVPFWEHYHCEAKVSLNYTKEISKKHQVGISSVSLAALTGAIRTLLIENQVKPLPKSVTISGPFALPWRLDGLNNQFTTIPISVPVGTFDPVLRLRMIENTLKKLHHASPLLLASFAMFNIIGSLPCWLTKYMYRFPALSAAFSIAPGFSDYSQKLGLNVKDFRIFGGMPLGNIILLGFYSLSMNGVLNLRVEGDKYVFPRKEDCERFMDNFNKELDILSSEKNEFIVVHNTRD